MAEVDDDALKSPFRRRGVRILVTALGVNATLALLLVGGPWLRGVLRAKQARHDFAEFAACLWGGRPAPDPGFGLPEGEELRYAHQVLHADADWPRRCRPALGDVQREPAWMLFPAIKQAEAVVFDAVAHVDEGLMALQEERASPPLRRVSMDLHRRVDRLLATLSNLATESGTEGRLTAPAIDIDDEPLPVVMPTRVPLKVSKHVTPRMWAHGDGLVTCAVDRRTVAYAKVGAGGMSLQRVRRPGLVQGTVPGPRGHPWLVWAMPDARCEAKADACAGHASGVARLERHHARAPEPLWLAAHPHGDLERTVRVRSSEESTAVDIVARRPEGGAEIRRFLLDIAELDEDAGKDRGMHDQPSPTSPPADDVEEVEEVEEPPAPRDADFIEALPPGDAAVTHWVPSVEPAVHVTTRGGTTTLWTRSVGGSAVEPTRVASASLGRGDDPPWLKACAYGKGAWVLYGRGPDASLVRLDRSGRGRGADVLLRLGQRRRHVALACNEAEASVVRADHGSSEIAWWSCGLEGCEVLPSLDARARHVEAIREGDATVVAFAEDTHSQVRVAVRNDCSPEPTAPRAVAPCFGEDGGHCGRPVLAARNGRILLGARDGADLLVVETVDGGRSWLPMRGLR